MTWRSVRNGFYIHLCVSGTGTKLSQDRIKQRVCCNIFAFFFPIDNLHVEGMPPAVDSVVLFWMEQFDLFFCFWGLRSMYFIFQKHIVPQFRSVMTIFLENKVCYTFSRSPVVIQQCHPKSWPGDLFQVTAMIGTPATDMDHVTCTREPSGMWSNDPMIQWFNDPMMQQESKCAVIFDVIHFWCG